MLTWFTPLKDINPIPKVFVACKYYLIVDEDLPVNGVQYSLYITSSSEELQLAGEFKS